MEFLAMMLLRKVSYNRSRSLNPQIRCSIHSPRGRFSIFTGSTGSASSKPNTFE